MVSVIVPVYFCDPSLYQVIDCSLRSVPSEAEFIVVDDCSPLAHPWRVEVQNKSNMGFTATVNAGLRVATEDIIVVMNDDIKMTEECFNRFKGLKGLQIASPADTSSSPDDRFGACWGMTWEVYELLGPLNEEYRHFYSDLDYYQRAKHAGVEIIKWQDIVLEHPESSTYKTLDKELLLEEDRKRFEDTRGV